MIIHVSSKICWVAPSRVHTGNVKKFKKIIKLQSSSRSVEKKVWILRQSSREIGVPGLHFGHGQIGLVGVGSHLGLGDAETGHVVDKVGEHFLRELGISGASVGLRGN